MERIVKAKVTREMINTGVCADPWNCPIARALQKAMDYPTTGITVRTHYTIVGNQIATHTDAIRHWIRLFDQTKSHPVSGEALPKACIPELEFEMKFVLNETNI